MTCIECGRVVGHLVTAQLCIDCKRDAREQAALVAYESTFAVGQTVVERGVGCLGKIVKIAQRFSKYRVGDLSAFVKFGDLGCDYAWIPLGNLEHATEECDVDITRDLARAVRK